MASKEQQETEATAKNQPEGEAAVAQEAAAAPPRMPVFYREPRPLDSARHAGKSISGKSDFSFARATNSVPLNVVEFSLALRRYPIVFTRDEPVVPVAVLGLRSGENLFVSGDGGWASGSYIPAYVRRYPFIFLESADKLNYTLCVDEASALLVDGDERPLFADGKPSDFTNGLLQFCSAYQGHTAATLEFTAALQKQGLLTENRADASLKSGERVAVSGFKVVDEAKFTALPDDVFLDWRQRGWLGLVYCHLLSTGNWQVLVDRAAEKGSKGTT